MAKRGVLEHEKTFRLADALGIPELFALGVLEGFWHWAARHRPHGDLTGVTPAFLARAIRYPEAGDRLWRALVSAGWLDILDDGRALIHDWSEHADHAVHALLKKRGECFADGHAPFARNRAHGAAVARPVEAIKAGKVVEQPIYEPETPEDTVAELSLNVLGPVYKPDLNQAQTVPEPDLNRLGLPVASSQKPVIKPKPGGIAPARDGPSAVDPPADPLPPAMIASAVMDACRIAGWKLRDNLEAIIRAEQQRSDMGADALRSQLIEAWQDYERAAPKLKYRSKPEDFFGNGVWRTRDAWPWKEAPGGTSNGHRAQDRLDGIARSHSAALARLRGVGLPTAGGDGGGHGPEPLGRARLPLGGHGGGPGPPGAGGAGGGARASAPHVAMVPEHSGGAGNGKRD